MHLSPLSPPLPYAPDLYYGSGNITARHKQTVKQTDKQSHRQTLLKTIPPLLRYAARVVNTTTHFIGTELFLRKTCFFCFAALSPKQS